MPGIGSPQSYFSDTTLVDNFYKAAIELFNRGFNYKQTAEEGDLDTMILVKEYLPRDDA